MIILCSYSHLVKLDYELLDVADELTDFENTPREVADRLNPVRVR